MKFSYLILCILIFLAFSCDSSITPNSHNGKYPVILEKKSENKLHSLIEKYQSDNPSLCVFLDDYGLNDHKICKDREILRVKINDDDIDRLEKMAKGFLVKNREFTNIQNSEQLELVQSQEISGCLKCDGSDGDISTIGWKLSYKNQMYEELEVKNSGMVVFLDAKNVYQVYGHWYQNIVVPSVDQLDYHDARSTLIGKKFSYFDWTGAKTYTITDDSFGDYENKVIFPYETDQGLELRACLVVSAGIWHFYVDSTTGELVYKEQTIIF